MESLASRGVVEDYVQLSLRPNLVTISDNPLPDAGHVEWVQTRDGLALRAASWVPPHVSNGKIIVVMQGRTEFIERYAETIVELLNRGFHVIAFDWRGQGGSERLLANPRKGHVAHFDDYRSDLTAILELMTDRFGGLQRMALAHSMGGAVLLGALSQDDTLFERCVLSAPMIGLSMVKRPRMAHLAANVLALLGFEHAYVPGGTDGATFPFEDNPLTQDERRHAIAGKVFAVAPDLAIGSPTIGWTSTSFNAMAELQRPLTAQRIKTPILIAAGPQDRITSTLHAQTFADLLPNGRFLPINGAEHEVLLEIEPIRQAFWQAFDKFMA